MRTVPWIELIPRMCWAFFRFGIQVGDILMGA